MKILKKSIIGCLLLAGMTMSSCDFLDVVPEENATGEDMTKDRQAALNYLYSCYGYLPQPNNGTSSLDLLTGDEVVTVSPAFAIVKGIMSSTLLCYSPAVAAKVSQWQLSASIVYTY